MFKVSLLPWRNHLTGLDSVALCVMAWLKPMVVTSSVQVIHLTKVGPISHQRIRCLAEVEKFSFSLYLLFIISSKICLDLKKKTLL